MKVFPSARREIIVALAATAALLVLAGSAQPGNSTQVGFSSFHLAPPTQGQQTSILVRSSLVQVDATVTDKNGKHISGLKPENFQLSEDNEVQRLSAVDYFDVAIKPEEDGFGPIVIELEGLRDSAELRAICRDHRLIVLFFDRTSMSSEDMLRSVDESKRFVREQMTPEDLVAIASFGKELRVIQSFTNDREMLEGALEFLIPDKKAVSPSAPVDDPVNRRTSVATTEERLDAAAALAEMFEPIPGRKSVIHFTGGLGSPTGVNNPAVDTATGAANKSNVSFYEMDSKGLCVRPPEARIGRGGVPGPASTVGPSSMYCASVDALYTLAADTGGALFTNSNDYAPFFKQVQEDSTGYYLLAYDPSNKKLDGTYRAITVKLIGVPGGRVTFRAGYYAPKEQKK